MEAIDVLDGEYAVSFLSDGRRYLPTAEDEIVRLVAAGDADAPDLH